MLIAVGVAACAAVSVGRGEEAATRVGKGAVYGLEGDDVLHGTADGGWAGGGALGVGIARLLRGDVTAAAVAAGLVLGWGRGGREVRV
jgi:hypothetical protein